MEQFATFIGLCLLPGVGGVTLRNLLDRFGGIEAIRQAPPAALQAVPGVGPRISAGIQAIDPAAVSAAILQWREQGIDLLTWSDLRYPDRLLQLRDAPPLLFSRGASIAHDRRTVAIVGTRHPTPRARHLAEGMGEALAARGWTVISGLAWGIDMAAHTGAASAGRTVAVLGGGLNRIEPKKRALAARILENGALLSESAPDTTPGPAGLVARNRLISGLSRAVIVVEAGEQSGSLYTARFAHKQDRIIYAVDNSSAGNRLLLQNGARPLAPDFAAWDALAAELHALP